MLGCFGRHPSGCGKKNLGSRQERCKPSKLQQHQSPLAQASKKRRSDVDVLEVGEEVQ